MDPADRNLHKSIRIKQCHQQDSTSRSPVPEIQIIAQLWPRHEMAYILQQLQRPLFRFVWLGKWREENKLLPLWGRSVFPLLFTALQSFLVNITVGKIPPPPPPTHHYDFRLRFMVPQQPHVVLS
jgi:hypothetical protein